MNGNYHKLTWYVSLILIILLSLPGFVTHAVYAMGSTLKSKTAGKITDTYQWQAEANNKFIQTAAYTVNNFNDLVDEISNAPTDGTETMIEITSDVSFTDPLHISQGTNIIIQSSSGLQLTLIQTVSDSRHFIVDGNLTLQNITLDGNSVGGGARIVNNGSLIINEGAVLENCMDTSGAGGGGINVNSGIFTMNGGEIRNNETNREGGGVFVNNGSFFMNGGSITGNVAAQNGGGVSIDDNSQFSVDSGTISYNRTETTGGGVHSTGFFTMINSVIHRNSAQGSGGGIYSQGNLTMTGTTIAYNETFTDGGGTYVSGGYFEMENTNISTNTADHQGGGVYVNDSGGTFLLTSGVIEKNESIGNGGGVYTESNDFKMTGGSIKSNKTTPKDEYWGGGVFMNAGRFEMTSGEISDNESGGAGGVYLGGGNFIIADDGEISNNRAFAGGGGGVLITGSGDFDMDGGKINNNTAQSNGGGVLMEGGEFTITDGAISANQASNQGGGVHEARGGVFIMSGGTIGGDDPQTEGNISAGNGGGIYVLGLINITGGTIKGNESIDGHGGGIFLQGNYSIANTTISGNKAGLDGGGMYKGGDIVDDTPLVMTNTIIRDNTADRDGGGMRMFADLTMSGSTIASNQAGRNGGGIASSAMLDIIENNLITNNVAVDGDGGGISIGNYSLLTTEANTTFSENSASVLRPFTGNPNDYPFIEFLSTSAGNHPLNNYDINYEGSVSITYDANGGTGSHVGISVLSGEFISVLPLEDTGISRAGFDFKGWNSEADGSGIFYESGEEITLTSSIVLYAQWSSPLEATESEQNYTSPKTDDPGTIFLFIKFCISMMILFFIQKKWNKKNN